MTATRLRVIFVVGLVPTLLFPTSLHAEVTAVSQAEDILSFVKLHLKEIKDEPEAVRQAVIREVADLEISLGRFEDALAEDIRDPNYKEMILSRAAVKQCEQGDREGAETKVAKIGNRLYRVDAHTGMGAALAARGDPLHAGAHFKEASDLFFFLANDEDKIERQKNLVFAEFEAGYFEQAASTIDGIFDDRDKAKVLSKIMSRIHDQGLYEKIRFLIEATQDRFVRDELREELALLEVKAGLTGQAASLASTLPAPAGVRAFCEIALSRHRVGMKEEAGEFLGKAEEALLGISDFREKARALGVLASTQSRVGMRKEAESGFGSMKSFLMRLPPADAERAELFVVMAEGHRANGQSTEAYTDLYEARNSLSGSQDLFFKTRLLSRIAKNMLLLEREAEAKEFFDHCLRWVREAGSLEQKTELMIRIASDQAEGGLETDAVETLERAASAAAAGPDESQREALLERGALAYLERKDLTRAVELVERIRRPLSKGSVFRAILFEYSRKGEGEQAVETAKTRGSGSLVLRGLLGAASGILERSLEIG